MGKKIRSFFISFIILIIFSGFLFFLGWTQFKIKPYSVGIVVSKLGGISESVVENGKFSWHWDFLIPTNAELRLFSTKPYKIERKILGELPSGNIYSNLYKNNPDFSYNFDFSIIAIVRPEVIISLLKNGVITDQASLDEYVGYAVDDFIRSAVDKIMKKSLENTMFLPEVLNYDDLFSEIKLSSKYSDIEIEKVSVKNVKIPDYNLYQKARNYYLSSQSFNDDSNIDDRKNGSVYGNSKSDDSSIKSSPNKNENDTGLIDQLKSILNSN